MLKIAELRKDVMSRFVNALMLGDVEERVRILADVGQIPLAALTANVHGLHDYTKALEESVKGVDLESVVPEKPVALIPPVPIFRTLTGEASNWPLLTATKRTFHADMKAADHMPSTTVPSSEEGISLRRDEMSPGGVDAAHGVWGDLDEALRDVSGNTWGDDLHLAMEASPSRSVAPLDTSPSARVSPGEKPSSRWLKGQPMVSDLVAAGEFEEALSMLQKTIGLGNNTPLKPLFARIYQASQIYLEGMPLSPQMCIPLLEEGFSLKDKLLQPMRLFNLPALLEMLRDAHRMVTAGKFAEALVAFQHIIQCIPLIVAASQEEESQALELLSICRSYILGMRIECMRIQVAQDDVARSVELAGYFTCCKMQPFHQFLVLKLAMGVAFKANNFITTAHFARRLIQGNFSLVKGSADELSKAKKVLAICEQKGTDMYPVDFDPAEADTLSVCASTLKRLDPSEASVRCPFCESVSIASFKGKICANCDLSIMGARVLGVKIFKN